MGGVGTLGTHAVRGWCLASALVWGPLFVLWMTALDVAGAVVADAIDAQGTGILELPGEGLLSGVKYHALVRPDPEAALDPERLLASNAGFAPYDPELDDRARPLWLKLQLTGSAEADVQYVLLVARRFFRQFEFYTVGPDGDTEHRTATFNKAITARTVGRQYAFDFTVPRGEAGTLLLYVDTVQQSLGPLELWIQDRAGFTDSQIYSNLVFGLLFGVLLALIFHNFILYLNLRQPGNLLYVLAMLSLLLMLGLDSGLMQTYLLPDFMQSWVVRLNTLFGALMMITISLFFHSFVGGARHLPRLIWVVRGVTGLLMLIAVVLLLVPVKYFLTLTLALQPTLVGSLLLLLVGSYLAGRRGAVEGYIFLAGWSLFVLGGLSRTVITFDMAARSPILEYFMYFGAVMEASILALGLSHRVRQLYDRHDKALREQHRVARLANVDPLTNAYNRRFLHNYLESVLGDSAAGASDRAVLILDLDNFKQANDDYGHAAGDMILHEMVARCQQVMREADVLCRLGGDEFVIVVADQRDRSGVNVAERVVETIAGAPFTFEGQSIAVTTSVGVLTCIAPDSTVSDVLRMADQALYQAKQAGRNRFTLYDPDQDTPFRHGASPRLPEREREEQQIGGLELEQGQV